jgi:hypothetical protein
VLTGKITISTTTSPVFEYKKHTSAGKRTAVYKTAESKSTRNIGIKVVSLVRTVETLRSIIQIRYASNPGHIQALDIALAEMCLPELNKLVAIVETRNASTHRANSAAKMLLPYCEQMYTT